MKDTNNLVFYVAENGNDQWTGKLAQPNGSGDDGPFATLNKAVTASRTVDKSKNRKIIVREGNYYNVSVELIPEDSGLSIEAMDGETPVLYGGRKITGWKKEEKGDLWFAELPEVQQGELDFRLLIVNGRLCSRSRLPENGTFQHLTEFDVPWMSTTDGGWKRQPTQDELTTMEYNPEDLGSWLDIRNAELTIFHKWDESSAGIAAHDTKNHVFRLSNSSGHPPGAFGYKGYIVWNIREGLTKPGQWYLDRSAGKVVYWPLPDEKMDKAVAFAPEYYSIINFNGIVRDVSVKGLTLSVTNSPLIAAGFGAFDMPGALQSLDGLENCRFTALKVYNTAGHAVKILGNNSRVSIEDCEIISAGAGGIVFHNNKSEAAGTAESDCLISNNLIQHTGLISPSAIAIAAYCCNIIHNEISNTTYTGISCSGSKSHIEYNLITKAMQVLNDGAAIYATFSKDGMIKGNIIKDIQQGSESDSTKNAIYLDEQCEGWTVEKNLVINCTQPEFNHMATHNAIRNNVFVCNSYIKMNFIRCKEYLFEKNILFAKDKIIFAGNPGAVSCSRNNILYSLKGICEEHYINEVYKHYETLPLVLLNGNINTDPLFRDLESDDFNLEPGSPAFRLEIENIDVKKAGRLH